MSDARESAVAWLDTEPRTPLLLVWCSRPDRRCRLGTVYATPHGLLLTGWQQTKVLEALDRPSARHKLRRAVLLSDRDGADIETEPFCATCRHGQPTQSGLVDIEQVSRVARDVLTGKTKRPASVVVE